MAKKFSSLLLLIVLVLPGCAAKQPTQAEQFRQLRIYQVMVEAFIDGDPARNYGAGYGPSHHNGDLRGVIQALPYIKDLGMNAVWLTPIFDSDAADDSDRRLDATGYFCRDYFKIDPNFGTLDDARELVQKAHELGLYVFFDGAFGHHKEDVQPSPSGLLPVGNGREVKYPESLPFYKEVATYWIDTLGIDGWRCDQAYQVPIEAWRAIRQAVEEKCAARRKAGEKWGTLGYMVAEVWSVAEEIATKAYGTEENPGLLSAFDFPMRYYLVQAFAVEEKGFGRQPLTVLQKGFESHRLYPSFAIPNLMLTNHDLVRFGDLIERAGYGGPQTRQYWQRHRAALSFLAAYTGPVTIYYGDEIGAQVPGFAQKVEDECWLVGLCDDHVSRSSGKISGFSRQEQRLHDYVCSLLRMRAQHPALWNGERQNLLADSTLYADLKISPGERIVYLLNSAAVKDTLILHQEQVGGRRLQNLLSHERVQLKNGHYAIPVDGLSGAFYAIE